MGSYRSNGDEEEEEKKMKITWLKEKQLAICHSDLLEVEKQEKMKELVWDYISESRERDSAPSKNNLRKEVNKDYGVVYHE